MALITHEEIAGKWQGEFTYGKGYPPDYRKKKCPFTLDLQFVDGVFLGTCVDEDVEKFFDEPASIEGVFDHFSIMFIKRYPCLLANENGITRIFPDKPSVGIQYTGRLYTKLFSKKIYFKGEWSISGSFLDEGNNPRYYSSKGKWRMEKLE